MKIDVGSTFEEFSTALTQKVDALSISLAFEPRKLQEELFLLRRNCFKVASECFPVEIKSLLTHHALIRKFGALALKAEQHLRVQAIQYNIFEDLFVLQTISKTETLHQRFMFTDVLMKEYFGITSKAPHFHLLAGFCEDAKINETLQLIFYLVAGANAD